ncbi:hypothetical protein Q9Q99_06040 [Curtobacterium flaccumfaciens]|nr:hypothetical protein Q9Q99_06040 [Curtobacterium flaccumfaciens]
MGNLPHALLPGARLLPAVHRQDQRPDVDGRRRVADLLPHAAADPAALEGLRRLGDGVLAGPDRHVDGLREPLLVDAPVVRRPLRGRHAGRRTHREGP